jgi:hypothetical protein
MDDGVGTDLKRLALMRCEQSFRSVDQLLDTPQQGYGLAVMIAVQFIMIAAAIMRGGLEQEGKTITERSAIATAANSVITALKETA